MSKIFIDTNILVYASDERDKKKQDMACRSLLEIKGDLKGVISTQIIQEFFVVATKKLGIEPLVAKEIISSYETCEIVQISTELIHEAINCYLLDKISFWDALAIVAAKSAGCDKILTEDLVHGQVIQGIKVENPFRK